MWAMVLLASATAALAQPPADNPPGMVWIPGGEFTMGDATDFGHPSERPAHRVRVDGFWMDEAEVTNAQFRQFVEATGYVTTAERPVDWEELKKQVPPGTPRPPDEMLQPGSLRFTPPDHPVPLDRFDLWWTWTPGASWRQPDGPGSSIEGKDDHPVVHVSWDDAAAYANWAGKRLPTEAEWEYAARGGLDGKRYVWGDEPPTDEDPRVNIWFGTFPHQSELGGDRHERTAPVKTFKPNGYGLYEMTGNVWEWCGDWYRPDTYARRIVRGGVDNPIGPASSFDPAEPLAPKRVMRGGSFLCHDSYCHSYRPSARRGNTPDTGLSHVGFRCVTTPALRRAAASPDDAQ